MSADLLGMIAVIAFSIMLFSVLGVGAVLVIRDMIRQRGNWGINLKPGPCRQCGTPSPIIRKPANWRQAMWGGWTCAECGLELDKWGQPVEGQAPGKWAVLRAVEQAEQNDRPQPPKDKRIREANEQTQRGKKP